MKKFAAVAALTITASIGIAAPASAASYDERLIAYHDCTTFERYGPFWGRVLLGGRNPDRFPPCGTHPGAKRFGPAFSK